MTTKLFGATTILTLALFGAGAVLAQAPDESQPPDQSQDQAQDQSQAQGQMQQSAPPPAPAGAPDESQDQSQSQGQPQAQPGVARISMIRGDASTQRGDSGDWSAATVNQPLEAGDKISTGANAQAEVQLDFADILRLDQHAQANITALGNQQIQVQVAQGLVNFSIFKHSESDVEIDTPNVAVHPSQDEGSFRILVLSDTETQVIVRNGQAEISTPQGSTHVSKGQLITIDGTAQDAQYKVTDAPDKDAFDSWNESRDKQIQDAQSWQHTDPYYVGTQDLDNNGSWVDSPDYGQVWEPNVGPGWAPYQDGQWVYEPYYGWTWVSYEPWGWAPYHYGRWFLCDNSWAWWPGPVYGGGFGFGGGWGRGGRFGWGVGFGWGGFYRPIWAPAYVSFFGFGGGFGVGFGFGSYGWLPIGPGDRFFPWYGGFGARFGFADVNRLGFRSGGFAPLRAGGFSTLGGFAGNDRLRGAISTVPADRFGAGRVGVTPATRDMVRQGSMITGRMPVAPTRASLSASGRAANPSTISSRADSQHFYSVRQTAAVSRSFDQTAAAERQSIQQNARYGANNAVNDQRGGAQSSFSRPGGAGSSSAPGGEGWHRFGDSGSGNANERGSSGAGNEGGNRNTSPSYRPGDGGSNGGNRPAADTSGRGAGYQQFSPSSRSESGAYAGGNYARPSNTSPSYRPPLNMHQPVVSRPNANYGGGYGGGNYGRPSYDGSSRGGYNAPSRSYSAPSRSYSAPSRSYSAPGGGSRGGGYSGGGRSSGGGGGGSRGGGGGSHGGGGGHHR